MSIVPFDIHTHNMNASVQAFINLPMDMLENNSLFYPKKEKQYSAGIFPLFKGNWEKAYQQLEKLSQHPQIKAIGECGLDKRSHITLPQQIYFYQKQANLAIQLQKPLIIHCVGYWNELINTLTPSNIPFIIHGFRGKPQLAEILLKKGFSLSFGIHFNPESLALCPPNKRYMETDNNPSFTIDQVAKLHLNILNI